MAGVGNSLFSFDKSNAKQFLKFFTELPIRVTIGQNSSSKRA
jgi:hypothetical protein